MKKKLRRHVCRGDSRCGHPQLLSGQILKWLWLVLLIGIPHLAKAATCPINSSMTQLQIQSTLSSCGAGDTATFASGTYTLTSALTVPCGVNVSGPAVTLAAYNPGDGYYRLGYTPVATIKGNLGRSNWLMSLDSCSTAMSITYLAFNGEQPSGGGGGGLYVPANNSNLSVSYNWFYGNQTVGTSCCGDPHDSLIWMDGNNPANNAQNDAFSWNRFGSTNGCSNIMSNISGSSYQGGSAGSVGGYCAGLGIHTGATNLVVENNDFYYLEQGTKHFSGTSNTTSFCNGCTLQNNDFSNVHRIGEETQINPLSGAEVFRYNSYHDPFVPFYATFGISAANGTNAQTNTTYNLLIANVSPQCCGQGTNEYIAMADELWGHGSTSENNWIQGFWQHGIQYNSDGTFTISDNSFCGQGGPSNATGNAFPGMQWVNKATSANTPTVSGNTPSGANTINAIGSTTCSAATSAAPTISPSGGAQTFPLTVTLSDAGVNTGIWYTTDGSTPVPGKGTASYLSSGGTFDLSSAATVNAVGMWGALNQPTSYPSGYGFVPSSVVTATYTSGGGGVVMGNSTDNSAGTTAANYFNDLYAVTGSNIAGYTVNTGTVCLAPGTVTNNKNTDIGINTAPTSTTEGTTALCHGTYTNSSSTSPGCVTVPMTGCGTLASNTPYWLWTITNDPLPTSPLYFSNCGGSCNGSAPTVGIGTYGGFYLHGTYGSYAGMSSTFTGGPVTGGQPSVYLNLTPSLVVGNSTDNSAGTTAANYFNDVYVVTGSDPAGYTVNTGTVCIAPGTVTINKNTDIGINTAPTATTEGTTALCHATYTNNSSTSPGCVTVPLTGCGTLAANTPYWLWTITNDPIASSPLYFSNCGGSCSGSAPTTEGVGTYGRFYLHGTYGTYTGMSPAFTGGPVTAGQPSVYLSATPK
jgi:hypothetical protein